MRIEFIAFKFGINLNSIGKLESFDSYYFNLKDLFSDLYSISSFVVPPVYQDQPIYRQLFPLPISFSKSI